MEASADNDLTKQEIKGHCKIVMCSLIFECVTSDLSVCSW